MKRLLIILLGLTLSFAVVSCESNGGKENIEDNPEDDPIVDLPLVGFLSTSNNILSFNKSNIM